MHKQDGSLNPSANSWCRSMKLGVRRTSHLEISGRGHVMIPEASQVHRHRLTHGLSCKCLPCRVGYLGRHRRCRRHVGDMSFHVGVTCRHFFHVGSLFFATVSPTCLCRRHVGNPDMSLTADMSCVSASVSVPAPPTPSQAVM